MFHDPRRNLVEVRKRLALAGFMFTGNKYVHTTNKDELRTYLATFDLSTPHATRRKRASEIGFFCSLVMMFLVVDVMGTMQSLILSN